MSNKVQINCNPQNKLRVRNLKMRRLQLQENYETLQTLLKEIKLLEIEENTQLLIHDPINNYYISKRIPILDPYHPNFEYYMQRINDLESIQRYIKLNQMWIRIISSELATTTC